MQCHPLAQDFPLPETPPTPTRKHARTPDGSGDSTSSGKASSADVVPSEERRGSLRQRPPLRRTRGTDELTTLHVAAPSPSSARGSSTTFPPQQELEAERAAARAATRRRRPNMVAFHSRYKPFYLVGIGALGNWLYGTGTVAIERGVFPRRPVAEPGAPFDALPPVYQPLFGIKAASISIGVTSTTAGVALALLSCALGFQDARALARKQNTARPSYTRANTYAACHVGAIVLSVGYRFAADSIRDMVSRDYTWAAAVPGWLGQAVFAVTQAQAFSGSELHNGKMPLKYRGAIGFSARAGMGLFTLYGAMAGVPYLSAYGKEVVRLAAVSSSTLAYSLPLTTARISRQATLVPRPTDEAVPMSWRAFLILAAFIVGRACAGFGPDLLQRGLVTANKPTDKTGVPEAFGGSLTLAVGTGLCVIALMLFRDDARQYDPKRGDLLLGLGFTGLVLTEVYRLLFEYGLNAHMQALVWVAVCPGLVGTALRLAVLPELFCYSELYNGDIPLKHRYQLTEACRAGAQLGFGVWGAMCAVPGFSPFTRELVAVLSGALATLGMALPTTTSRRTLPQYAWPLSPGATPGVERSNPLGSP